MLMAFSVTEVAALRQDRDESAGHGAPFKARCAARLGVASAVRAGLGAESAAFEAVAERHKQLLYLARSRAGETAVRPRVESAPFEIGSRVRFRIGPCDLSHRPRTSVAKVAELAKDGRGVRGRRRQVDGPRPRGGRDGTTPASSRIGGASVLLLRHRF